MTARFLACIPSAALKLPAASPMLLRAKFRIEESSLTTTLSMRAKSASFHRPFTMLQRLALPNTAVERKSGELPPLDFDDGWIKETLNSTRTIAMDKGFRVVPINPGSAGKKILGEKCCASLMEMQVDGVEVDMVDCFQKAERIPVTADQAITIGAKILRMQVGVRNEEAAAKAAAAGLRVMQDRCPKPELDWLWYRGVGREGDM